MYNHLIRCKQINQFLIDGLSFESVCMQVSSGHQDSS